MRNDIIDNNGLISAPTVALRRKMMATIKTACLPKLICELTSSVHQDQLSEMERSFLNLIRYLNTVTLHISPSFLYYQKVEKMDFSSY